MAVKIVIRVVSDNGLIEYQNRLKAPKVDHQSLLNFIFVFLCDSAVKDFTF